MKNKKGFTLIELLAVIVVLGLLISVAVVSFSKNREKALDQEKVILRQTISAAFNNYRLNHAVAVDTAVEISNFSFSPNLDFNRNTCDNTDPRNLIEYKKIIDGEGELTEEEVFCIIFFCNDELIINDYETNENCN